MRSTPEHRNRPYRWVLAHGARETWHRFADDVRHTPDRARRRFAWTLTGGLGVALALTMGLVFLTRHLDATGRLGWEAAFLRRVEGLTWFSFSTALWAESPGNSVFMIPVMASAAILAVWLRRPLTALAVLASFFMLDLLVLAGWMTWNRTRPDLIARGIAAPGLHSFPSGHLSQMVSCYGLFTWMWIRSSRSVLERIVAVLMFAIVVAEVALARLRLGSHWPTDIAAGMIIGAVWLVVVALALRRAEALGGR